MAKPKLPKRPKATAGIGVLEGHLKAIRAAEKKYRDKLAAAKRANQKKQDELKRVRKLNEEITKARAAYKSLK